MKYGFLLFLTILLLTSCKSKHDREPSGNGAYSEIKEDRYGSQTENETQVPVIRNTDETKYPIKDANLDDSKNLSQLYTSLVGNVFMVFSVINEEQVSQGSGFFIKSNVGVTNFHVLDQGQLNYIYIEGEPYRITEILASSPTHQLDYVIFRTDYFNDSFLKISSKKSEIGEDVFAIGSPQGLENSLTKGAISGFRENRRIQIDATIDHGSSGGPLFNMKGEVIGITTSGLDSGSELNFAVDIHALPLLDHID